MKKYTEYLQVMLKIPLHPFIVIMPLLLYFTVCYSYIVFMMPFIRGMTVYLIMS